MISVTFCQIDNSTPVLGFSQRIFKNIKDKQRTSLETKKKIISVSKPRIKKCRLKAIYWLSPKFAVVSYISILKKKTTLIEVENKSKALIKKTKFQLIIEHNKHLTSVLSIRYSGQKTES